MNTILIEAAELGADNTVSLTDRRAAHIHTVLRAQPGQELRVGIIDGQPGVGTVAHVTATRVLLRIRLLPGAPPTPAISVLLALPRPKVMKRLWEPLASLGVRRILLTNAARVERNYFDTHWLEPSQYRARLLTGLEQAGATQIPLVSIHRQFRPLVEDQLALWFPDAMRLMADPSATSRVRDLPAAQGRPILLAIGPEGGWVPFELDLLAKHGFTPFRAAHGTLRSDVAAIALLALMREFIDR